jgi:hypothetical protein
MLSPKFRTNAERQQLTKECGRMCGVAGCAFYRRNMVFHGLFHTFHKLDVAESLAASPPRRKLCGTEVGLQAADSIQAPPIRRLPTLGRQLPAETHLGQSEKPHNKFPHNLLVFQVVHYSCPHDKYRLRRTHRRPSGLER